MKVKGPPIQPPVQPNVPAKTPEGKTEVKSKTTEIANALAGLVGSEEEVKQKRRSERRQALSETEKRKRLKAFGAKCGVSKNDTPREATQKIVHGVLSEEYDSQERGFKTMVDEITDFIQGDNPELKEKFDRWIETIQSET